MNGHFQLIIAASFFLLVLLIGLTGFTRRNRFARIVIFGIVSGLLLLTGADVLYFGVSSKKAHFIVLGALLLLTSLAMAWKCYSEIRSNHS